MEKVKRSTKVKLEKEWMGYSIGYIIALPTKIAQVLISRGTAVDCEVKEEVEEKKMVHSSHDKMVRRSTNK